ncbi:MAG: chromate efflux transporter [Caulobacteraceae bacterium]|nr:chromate efflux transporter [Caulobacteraceae bacterium]
MTSTGAPAAAKGSWGEVFLAFLGLGLTAFGGPIAHLGYFREAFVVRRGWLSEAAYGDIVALCQFLPGPASSQTALALGRLRAGYGGAFAAWLGFTAPSAALMILFAYVAPQASRWIGGGWVHGLKIAAVAVVAQAVLAMGRTLAPDRPRAALMVAAAVLSLVWASPLSQFACLAAGAAVGAMRLRAVGEGGASGSPSVAGRRRVGAAWLALFAALLVVGPLLAGLTGDHGLDLFARFFRTGALVFGGGHVVLPLLQAEVVRPGWIDQDAFLAGYGAVQAAPGPLFTFAAYLGAAMRPAPNGVAGGLLCLAAMFLPSFLLVFGVWPFWERVRRFAAAQGALRGANAAVTGLLLAVLYDPLWTGAIQAPKDAAVLAVAAGSLLAFRAPPWVVTLFCAAAGAVTAG